MLTFIDYLTEKRKNPKINIKQSPYEMLEKYKDDSNIYITFTQIAKVGINPQSAHNTVNGIYWIEKMREERG